MFKKDITSYMAFFPVLFFAGIIFVCFYIVMLVSNVEAKTIQRADRYDLIYKIVFTLTLILLITRSFIGDFMCTGGSLCDPAIAELAKGMSTKEIVANGWDYCHSTKLNVPIVIIVTVILSGLVTWFTPKIKDNNNQEF